MRKRFPISLRNPSFSIVDKTQKAAEQQCLQENRLILDQWEKFIYWPGFGICIHTTL